MYISFFRITPINVYRDQIMAINHINSIFASAQKGSDIITTQDDYLKRLSPFDRQSKMQKKQRSLPARFCKIYGTKHIGMDPGRKGKS